MARSRRKVPVDDGYISDEPSVHHRKFLRKGERKQMRKRNRSALSNIDQVMDYGLENKTVRDVGCFGCIKIGLKAYRKMEFVGIEKGETLHWSKGYHGGNLDEEMKRYERTGKKMVLKPYRHAVCK